MNIYDPISLSLDLEMLDNNSYYVVYILPLEKTSTKTHNAPNRGVKFSTEWCDKISKSLKGRISPMKGKKLPDNHPFKQSKKEQMHTEETKLKIKNKLTGRKLSEETKKRLSETRKRKFASGEIIHPKGMLGKESKLKGKHLSQNHKDKISHTKNIKKII